MATEQFRPEYHFTPAKNWQNDPNGPFYYGGQYHLYFQHNPFGDQWGNMSWGHAVGLGQFPRRRGGGWVRQIALTSFLPGAVVIDFPDDLCAAA